MPKIGRFNVSILLLCLLAAAHTNGTNDTTTSVTGTTTSSKPSTPSALLNIPAISTTSTCPARTVNYITHTLPQQCLRSSRTALGNLTTATATDGIANAANSTLSAGAVATSTQIVPVSDNSQTSNEKEAVVPTESNAVPTAQGADTDPVATPLPDAASDAASFDPNTIALAATEQETDSPLDDAKFVSFEEWKKQNLAKAGQSPEDVGKGRASAADGQRRPVINNALDSLGDDGEIELDFGGFGSGDDTASRWTATAGSQTVSDTPASAESLSANAERPISKDAGTTCKERFNYASFDCAATILKTNSKVKSPSSVLVENKDSYMLNECGVDNKFIIVELCDDITIDTVVLANFEFFSSQFRTFRVSVSDRYPVKLDRWKDLGTFEARNSREIQAFAVHSNIWARYLRIEFLTHYGAEFYCPLSLVRVHGKTMMEEFRNQDEAARVEEDDEEQPVVEPQVNTAQEQKTMETVPVTPGPVVVEKTSSSEPTPTNATMPAEIPIIASNLTESTLAEVKSPAINESASTTAVTLIPSTHSQELPVSNTSLQAESSTHPTESIKTQNTAAVSISSVDDGRSFQSETSPSSKPVQGPEKSPIKSSIPTVSPSPPSPSPPEQRSSSTSSLAASVRIESKPAQASPEIVKPATPTSQQQPPTPTTQENFFKSVHKRLQMLESNSTLSLQYIEEQSRILRDAFMQVEKRQLGKTEKFLGTLNDSVMTELRWFRTQYDQLWQSTVIELETHQQQYQREMLAVSSRLTIMADELVFQKRMIVVQSTLLLLCLGLVIFVRSGSPYLELPLMQQVMNKSHNMLKLSFESPPGSPSSRESSPELRKTRRLVRQSSGTSEGSFGSPLVARSTIAPDLEFSPPTPSEGHSERSSSPTLDPDTNARVRQTKSGPATPSGTRENQNPLEWDDARSDSPVQDGNKKKPGRDGSSQPSLLRYSGSSDFDESTADRERARTNGARELPLQDKSAVSQGSSEDGDIIAEMLIADGFGD